MQAIVETSFDVVYLATVITIGICDPGEQGKPAIPPVWHDGGAFGRWGCVSPDSQGCGSVHYGP